MNINKDLIIKAVGVGLTLAGTVVTTIADTNESKKLISKLVNEQLKK